MPAMNSLLEKFRIENACFPWDKEQNSEISENFIGKSNLDTIIELSEVYSELLKDRY